MSADYWLGLATPFIMAIGALATYGLWSLLSTLVQFGAWLYHHAEDNGRYWYEQGVRDYYHGARHREHFGLVNKLRNRDIRTTPEMPRTDAP